MAVTGAWKVANRMRADQAAPMGGARPELHMNADTDQPGGGRRNFLAPRQGDVPEIMDTSLAVGTDPGRRMRGVPISQEPDGPEAAQYGATGAGVMTQEEARRYGNEARRIDRGQIAANRSARSVRMRQDDSTYELQDLRVEPSVPNSSIQPLRGANGLAVNNPEGFPSGSTGDGIGRRIRKLFNRHIPQHNWQHNTGRYLTTHTAGVARNSTPPEGTGSSPFERLAKTRAGALQQQLRREPAEPYATVGYDGTGSLSPVSEVWGL